MTTPRHHDGDRSASAAGRPELSEVSVLPKRTDEPAPSPPEPRPLFDLGGVVSAVARYPITVIVCAILGLGGGLLVGYTREPTYTASAEMLVGNLSVSDPSAIPGAVGASRALANVYARLLGANEVQKDVRAATGDDADATVTATPVPESPLIRVTATSTSEAGAIDAANIAGTSLAEYVGGLESPGSDVTPIVRAFKRAQVRYQEERVEYERLVDRFGPTPTDSQQQQLNEANSDLETAKLKRNALQGLYARGQNIRISQPNLDVFSSAGSASSDRGSTMQLTGVIGLLAGLALGAAVARFRAGRRARRSTETRESPSGSLEPDQIAAANATADSQRVPPVTGTVAINSASFEEFRGLGFSVTQTSRVLAQRERTGGFKNLDELNEIPGLPRTFLDQLKGRLTL